MVDPKTQESSFLDTTSEEPEAISSTTTIKAPTTAVSESWPASSAKPDKFTFSRETLYFSNYTLANKYKWFNNKNQLSFQAVIDKMKTSEDFRTEFSMLFVNERDQFKEQGDKYPNPLFESMPLNVDTINDPWEFVLRDTDKMNYDEDN